VRAHEHLQVLLRGEAPTSRPGARPVQRDHTLGRGAGQPASRSGTSTCGSTMVNQEPDRDTTRYASAPPARLGPAALGRHMRPTDRPDRVATANWPAGTCADPVRAESFQPAPRRPRYPAAAGSSHTRPTAPTKLGGPCQRGDRVVQRLGQAGSSRLPTGWQAKSAGGRRVLRHIDQVRPQLVVAGTARPAPSAGRPAAARRARGAAGGRAAVVGDRDHRGERDRVSRRSAGQAKAASPCRRSATTGAAYSKQLPHARGPGCATVAWGRLRGPDAWRSPRPSRRRCRPPVQAMPA